MEKAKKIILGATLSLLLLLLAFIILLPYFSVRFEEIRDNKEAEEIRLRLVKEEQLRKEAEERIYLTGKFDPTKREDFTLIPLKYTMIGNNIYLRKETLSAFIEMESAARQAGINLKIASATRNFDYQKNLWNNKWSGVSVVEGKDLSKTIPNGSERFLKILEYSAAPATSRHHWGTDIDINGADPAYFNTEKGIKEYEWLSKNAPLFGFCQTYSTKGTDRPYGYNEEKWHWSYLPLSRKFTSEYKTLVRNEDIAGFMGDEYVPTLNLIDNYVLGINPECI